MASQQTSASRSPLQSRQGHEGFAYGLRDCRRSADRCRPEGISSSTRRCPAPASTRPHSGPAFAALVAEFAPAQPGAAGPARRPAGADRRLARGTPRQAVRSPSLRAFPHARSAICSPRRRRSPSPPRTSTPRSPASPGRSWWCRSINARYALNAGNARWGSLYDALYGTDAIPEDDGATRGSGFNQVRGALVVAKAREVLDEAVPLAPRQPRRRHRLRHRGRRARGRHRRRARPAWRDPAQLVGYRGEAGAPTAVLLQHNGLHVELVIDRSHPIGSERPRRPRRRGDGIRRHHHHGLRGQRRRRRCRRQGRASTATGSA